MPQSTVDPLIYHRWPSVDWSPPSTNYQTTAHASFKFIHKAKTNLHTAPKSVAYLTYSPTSAVNQTVDCGLLFSVSIFSQSQWWITVSYHFLSANYAKANLFSSNAGYHKSNKNKPFPACEVSSYAGANLDFYVGRSWNFFLKCKIIYHRFWVGWNFFMD